MTESKKVLVFCNPLLDISSNVTKQFLEKYQLLPGNAILADEKLHGKEFFDDLQAQKDTQFLPGGSGMNTARICSWIKQELNQVSYLGCVGKDKYADMMTTQAKKDGVVVSGMAVVEDGTSTGLCGVCITDKERSLVAALGAANKFTHDHLRNENVQQLLNDAQIMYITGFCLTVSPPSVFELANHCAAQNKVLAINISAPFIAAVFKDDLIKLLSLADIVFCNDTEAKALGAALGFDDMPCEDLAPAIVGKNVMKPNGKQTVVFTCGKDATIVATEDYTDICPVKPISEDSIIDMNGAGDAFVGGFLAMYAKGEEIRRCVHVGHYAAGVIIQHSGCQFPSKPSLPQA